MRHFLRFSIISFLLLLSSCAFDKDAVLEYDLYKVEVNTYLNIRDTPNKRGKIVGTINNGAIIDVAEVNDGWATVIYDGKQVGYVSSEFLSFYKARTVGNQPMGNVSDEDLADEFQSEPDIVEVGKGNIGNSQLANAGSEEYVGPDERQVDKIRFVGDKHILSDADRIAISHKLSLLKDYVFVINTVENVETGELFDYAPDLLENITKEMDADVSWWKRFMSWFGGEIPSSNLVLLSYIRDNKEGGLLQAECNGSSLKYVKMKEPHKYFKCQTKAVANPVDGIISMAELISNGGKEYSDHNWFIRRQIDTGDILENICDGMIVENILPRNSFWHNWVFGWIFAWPLGVANFLLSIFGSYIITLFIFMFLIVANQYYISLQIYKGQKGSRGIAGLLVFFNIFLWLAMLSIIIYMFPDMTNVFVMKESGFSPNICKIALYQYANMSLPSNWVLIAAFIVGNVISVGVKEGFFVNATLPSHYQINLYRKNEKNIEDWMSAWDVDYNKEELKNDNKPYLTLCMDYFGSKVGGTAPLIILSFIFSGALLLYGSIFVWTIALKKIVFVLNGILSCRKNRLYKH